MRGSRWSWTKTRQAKMVISKNKAFLFDSLYRTRCLKLRFFLLFSVLPWLSVCLLGHGQPLPRDGSEVELILEVFAYCCLCFGRHNCLLIFVLFVSLPGITELVIWICLLVVVFIAFYHDGLFVPVLFTWHGSEEELAKASCFSGLSLLHLQMSEAPGDKILNRSPNIFAKKVCACMTIEQ